MAGAFALANYAAEEALPQRLFSYSFKFNIPGFCCVCLTILLVTSLQYILLLKGYSRCWMIK
jgi:hypothetical protein